MIPHATHLIIEHLSRDPALVREAERRLTMRNEPTCLRDQIECAMRRRDRSGYAAIRNARIIRTHVRLGSLRRALVQWAAQHAPTDVGGFQSLLTWALMQVDWPSVVHYMAITPQRAAPRGGALLAGAGTR